ncbi:uncharacterized protein VP01_1775g1 [Puccinia sorghi]|uniref:Uncharacterized protein n=1 Tax=Puccinia sorghi TaxID=27349 RepID=A0A0L6VGK1_9BASI|nr:uncharacterized protein VP01_1775g1 [Puccinia sorghi]
MTSYSACDHTQTGGIPPSLHHHDAARSGQKEATFVALQNQAQATYLETAVGKLRSELARVRHSTSILQLSKSRHSLSSLERELVSELTLSNTKYCHVLRYFTKLQGAYVKAFSEITKTAFGKAGQHNSAPGSIESTLKNSIDPIIKEYEGCIYSLELELETITAPATKQAANTHSAGPLSMNLKSLSQSHFYPSADTHGRSQAEERVVNSTQTPGSEKVIRAGVSSDQGVVPGAGVGQWNPEKIDLTEGALQMQRTRISVDARGGNNLELLGEREVVVQWLSNYQELQIRHATTVDELEQVRILYLNTLEELDEKAAQHEQSQRAQRKPSLASLSNSYVASSPNPSAAPSSLHIQSRGSFINASTSNLVRWRSYRRDCSEMPRKASAEKEELLETINSPKDADQPSQLQEDACDSAVQLIREGDVSRSKSARNSTNNSTAVSTSRSYSISRTSSLQPLKLQLMRSSSLTLSEFSARQGLMKLPGSPAPALQSSLLVCSSPIPLDSAISQQSPLRSLESLEKEVLQLQEVLKQREEEIKDLELTIRQTARLSASMASFNQHLNSEGSSSLASSQIHPHLVGSPYSEVPPDGNQDDCDAFFPTLFCKAADNAQASRLESHRNEQAADSDSTKSLHVLMRAMAKKESEYLGMIENLKARLGASERQHEALVKLSADQMLNMSAEIEALREKLMSQTSDSEICGLETCSAHKLCEQARHELQSKNSEIEALKAEHDSAMAKLKVERSENFHQLFSFANEKLMAKEEELKQIEINWQNKLKVELEYQADFIWAESDLQQSNLLKAQSKSFQAKRVRDREMSNRETNNLLKKHAEEIAQFQEQADLTLKMAETEFANRIQELQRLHAEQVAQLTSTINSTTTEMYSDESNTREDETQQALKSRIQELEDEKLYLIAQHEMRGEQMQAEYEREISEAQAGHDEILIAALTELDHRRTAKFQAWLATVEEEHLSQINEIKLDYERQIAALEAHPAYTPSAEPATQSSRRASSVFNGRLNTMIDSAALEPHLLRQIQEQESGILKLTKQLLECEGNLKANTTSVAELEEALTVTERNLRKSRMQMNSLVQERDKMSIQNQSLETELRRSNEEIAGLKQSLQEERLLLQKKYEEQVAAKEAARNQLESRMLEMQNSRRSRKSRFNL